MRYLSKWFSLMPFRPSGGEHGDLRDEFIRTKAAFEAHMRECERMRSEDQQLQAERHQENQRRLDKQDHEQEKVIHQLGAMREDMSSQFMRMIWTVATGMGAVALSLIGFIVTRLMGLPLIPPH